jgi:hypothetical protein
MSPFGFDVLFNENMQSVFHIQGCISYVYSPNLMMKYNSFVCLFVCFCPGLSVPLYLGNLVMS